jgi:hypothetical protein
MALQSTCVSLMDPRSWCMRGHRALSCRICGGRSSSESDVQYLRSKILNYTVSGNKATVSEPFFPPRSEVNNRLEFYVYIYSSDAKRPNMTCHMTVSGNHTSCSPFTEACRLISRLVSPTENISLSLTLLHSVDLCRVTSRERAVQGWSPRFGIYLCLISLTTCIEATGAKALQTHKEAPSAP